MAKVKISELPTTTEFTDDDIIPLVDETGTIGATTKRGNIAQLREHLNDTTDLGDLSDVNVSGAVDGNSLVRSGGEWIASTPPGGASDLADLDDVNITSPANDSFLRYDTPSGKWIDELVAVPTLLDDLSDVNTSGVLDKDFLMFDDATDTWVDHTLLFDDISDVNLSGASNGDFLQRQSGVWVDRTLVLDDASDVNLSGAADGDFLQRQSGNWVDHALVISDATDVDTSGASDGDVLTLDSGTWVAMPPTGGGGGGGFGGAMAVAYYEDLLTSNFTITSASKVAVGPTLTFPCLEGDLIEVGFNGLWDAQAVNADCDVYTVISGTPTTSISGSDPAAGPFGWHGVGISNIYGTFGMPLLYTVQAADIVSGDLTIALYASSAGGASKTLLGDPDYPIAFYAKRYYSASGTPMEYAYSTITANVTVNSTSYMSLGLEATVNANEGDTLMIGGDWLWYSDGSNHCRMDAITRVASSDVNYVSGLTSGDYGVVGWFAPLQTLSPNGLPVLYTVQADDIEDGTVTVRLVAKIDFSDSRLFLAAANPPARFYVANIKGTGSGGGSGSGAGVKEIAEDTAVITYPGTESVTTLLASGPVCVLSNSPAVGDWIHLDANIFFQLAGGSYAYATLQTTVGGVTENYIVNTAGYFISSGVSNSSQCFNITKWYQLQSSDIDSGTVTFQFGGVTDGSVWWDSSTIQAANYGQIS